MGLASMSLACPGCPGNDDPEASGGTGGDEDMPDDDSPGPHGPACGERVGGPAPEGSHDDLAWTSQPFDLVRVVTLKGDPTLAKTDAPQQASSPTPSTLTAAHRSVGATTQDPHIHERWSESRKLELSYCVGFMPGEDAEVEANYHKTIRALNSTMAEWERVTGANFVHIVADDTPTETPPLVPTENGDSIARAKCATGTKAYFGMFTYGSDWQGVTNVAPQAWNDPDLEPLNGGVLRRLLQIKSNLVASYGDVTLLLVLRHELGHMMGFVHEEVNDPHPFQEGCDVDPDPRPVTPVDANSVMTTPGCEGVFSDDADHLTPRDRLSAFFLQHTPRARFETRSPSLGYRYSGVLGEGAEILWHTEGSTEGVLWRPQVGPDGISFVDQAFPYSSPVPPPPGGWFPNESEVVIPLRFSTNPTTFDLFFHGPGPDVTDLAVFNSGLTTTAFEHPQDSFAVPVIGRFDASDLDRDIVYLYQPGDGQDAALVASSGEPSTVTDVAQQSTFAYPLAAPYRGSGFPDDIVWLEPHERRVTTWRLGEGLLEVAQATRVGQGELGLVRGEHIPAIGDFNGDGRADIMWQGVSNLPAGLQDIVDVLWLSQSTATQLSFAVVSKRVGYSYRPFVGDFDADGIDDIFWQRSWGLTSDGPSAWSTGPSYVWYFDDTGGHETKVFALDADYSPYVGDFDADGCHDIAWFDAVGDTLNVWRCLPSIRDFDCGVPAPTPPDAAPVGMHWGF
jgi:hypothetical protein